MSTGWTFETLLQHLEVQIQALSDRLTTAVMTIQSAVDKAYESIDSRLLLLQELRDIVNTVVAGKMDREDALARFEAMAGKMNRDDALAQFEELAKRISNNETKLAKMASHREGLHAGWKILIAVVGLIGLLVSIAVARITLSGKAS